jgi:hypothetical protein
MERYPEHRFACSQAQQFKWLEQVFLSLAYVDKEAELGAQHSNIRPSLRRFKKRSRLGNFISSVVPGLKMTETCHPVRPLFDSLFTVSGISSLDSVNDARQLGYLIRSG